jgi:alanine dehydrogenase
MTTLSLRERDVETLLSPAEALAVVEESFHRIARGAVDNRPRGRLPLPGGEYAVMACVDRELGYAGLKTYAWSTVGSSFVVVLFSLESGRFEAVLEADRLGQLRTGAASGVAARYLAREGASSLGVIGCGWQAESQVACIRGSSPTAATGGGSPSSALPTAASPRSPARRRRGTTSS